MDKFLTLANTTVSKMEENYPKFYLLILT